MNVYREKPSRDDSFVPVHFEYCKIFTYVTVVLQMRTSVFLYERNSEKKKKFQKKYAMQYCVKGFLVIKKTNGKCGFAVLKNVYASL